MTQRVHTLDYLRGIMAVAIMFYHYGSWRLIAIPDPIAPVLNLLGLYGVSIFYVLSGAALSLIYFDRTDGPSWVAEYATKRFFRIAPLLWVATALTIALSANQELAKVLLNVTLLFGFFAHDEYIATGAWSLGNEVVFYAIFPAVIAISRYRYGIVVALFASVIVSAYFAVSILDPQKTVASQWPTYINPLNQIHLFVAGMAVGICLKRWQSVPLWACYAGALSATVGICLMAYTYQGAFWITNWQRYILSALCVVLCLSVGLVTTEKNSLFARGLGVLGATSYSIYLLHPIVLNAAVKFELRGPLGEWFVPLLIAAVLILSYLSYVLVERPGMSMARYLWRRPTPEPAVASTAP